MPNFNASNTKGNAKRLSEALDRGLKTPGISNRLSSDESDFAHHLLDVVGDIYFREKNANEQ